MKSSALDLHPALISDFLQKAKSLTRPIPRSAAAHPEALFVVSVIRQRITLIGQKLVYIAFLWEKVTGLLSLFWSKKLSVRDRTFVQIDIIIRNK